MILIVLYDIGNNLPNGGIGGNGGNGGHGIYFYGRIIVNDSSKVVAKAGNGGNAGSRVLTFFAVFTNIHKKLGQVKLNLIFIKMHKKFE